MYNFSNGYKVRTTNRKKSKLTIGAFGWKTVYCYQYTKKINTNPFFPK